ncbi:hypothetical protein, partial [Xanthomonas translucens]|uniref:hypothetical protein n=1 Tax=Xanthomonas campestris pv. translucens TaxID=343 RepID=UPI0019D3F6DA
PGAPVTPPPGWVPQPHRDRPGIALRQLTRPYLRGDRHWRFAHFCEAKSSPAAEFVQITALSMRMTADLLQPYCTRQHTIITFGLRPLMDGLPPHFIEGKQ